MKTAFPLAAVLVLALLCAVPAQGREYHVSVTGNDANDGTAASPLRTISAAAQLAQPGDVVTIHKGLYRERVNPPRGGESSGKPIVYRAAPGERPEIRGSEAVTGWEKVQNDTWKVVLPNSVFGDFNPYADLIRGDWFNPKGREHHTGAVYLNGEWLIEAAALEEVMAPAGTVPAWLEQTGDEYLVNVVSLAPRGWSEPVTAAAPAGKRGTQNAPCSEGGECVGFIRHGDWLKFEGVNFGENSDAVTIRAASASGGGVIELRQDAPDGTLLGSVTVPNTGGWQEWNNFPCQITPTSGVKTLCMVFRSLIQKGAGEEARLWFAKVDDQNTTIWAQFKDADPNEELVEINVRQSVFYPDQPGRNYITVRGLALRHAATNWAPPTAEQIGLIGTHWSKGWLIEDNVITHSVCSGIALGKHGDEFDNTSADTAEGYVLTIERAIAQGWGRENIGHHTVRNNTISHCEQGGIVGSLGAVFSTITGNTIHDIHVRRLFTGAEMAGIKIHAAIDTDIRDNHIYRTCQGLWLDWMAQGARVSGNLFHDNLWQDLFVEVNHGPMVVDNNLFLSGTSVLSLSRGVSFAHNLFAGKLNIHPLDERLTPYHKAHSTELAGMHNNPCGDDRYYNDLFTADPGFEKKYRKAFSPIFQGGCVVLGGGKNAKSGGETPSSPVVVAREDGFYLEGDLSGLLSVKPAEHAVNSELLGHAAVSGLPYENRDGSPLLIDRDYFGSRRNTAGPLPGPFELSELGRTSIKVWPKE